MLWNAVGENSIKATLFTFRSRKSKFTFNIPMSQVGLIEKVDLIQPSPGKQWSVFWPQKTDLARNGLRITQGLFDDAQVDTLLTRFTADVVNAYSVRIV